MRALANFDKTIRSALIVLSITLLGTGCFSEGSGDEETGSDETGGSIVLSSNQLTVRTYARPSTTLAVSESPYIAPGSTGTLVAYVYDNDTEMPVSGGEVSFSAELEAADGAPPQSIDIGNAPLVDGRAEIGWLTPVGFAGHAKLQAEFSGNLQYAPSGWGFSVTVAIPNEHGVVRYAMARLAHLVQRMEGPGSVGTTLASEYVDGPKEDLAQVLDQEFGLQLLESRYRIEGYTTLVIALGDAETFLKSAGLNDWADKNLKVRTTFLMAANDDVLVLVIKGTDGEFNEAVNDFGSPAKSMDLFGFDSTEFLFGRNSDEVAVHPGWAWMAGQLVQGFNTTDVIGFEGLAQLVQTHRFNALGKPRALYIAGHSLGGALAFHVALGLATANITMPDDRVYTYGAPWQGAYNLLGDIGFPYATSTAINFDFIASRASGIFATKGIELTYLEGSLDPIPPITENTTRKKWDKSPLGDKLDEWNSKICGTINKIGDFLDISTNCDFSKDRPIGYRRPFGFGIRFASRSHPRYYPEGDVAFTLCQRASPETCNGTFRRSDCIPTATESCNVSFEHTDVGDFNPLQKRAHWVGDYEFAALEQLRGNPLEPNLYFPPWEHGKLRQPLDIKRLP